jgi:hypothetical protein
VDRYIALDRKDAVTLVRAARQVRDALWVADTDPGLAWLFLVSAVEFIAGREALRGVVESDLLQREMHDLVCCDAPRSRGRAHLAAVAQKLVTGVKATARVLSCVERYLPEPPQNRPEAYACVDWGWLQRRKVIANYTGTAQNAYTGVFPAVVHLQTAVAGGPPDQPRPASAHPQLSSAVTEVVRGASVRGLPNVVKRADAVEVSDVLQEKPVGRGPHHAGPVGLRRVRGRDRHLPRGRRAVRVGELRQRADGRGDDGERGDQAATECGGGAGQRGFLPCTPPRSRAGDLRTAGEDRLRVGQEVPTARGASGWARLRRMTTRRRAEERRPPSPRSSPQQDSAL